MLDIVKNAVKQQLNNRCFLKYNKEVVRQLDAYGQWILVNEQLKKGLRGSSPKVAVRKMESFCEGFQIPEEDITIFVREGGELDATAIMVLLSYFEANPKAQLVYADEDCVDKTGTRHTPWFKPQWSPDTLHSFAYYGNMIAMRTQILRDALMDNQVYQQTSGEKNLYAMILKVTEAFGRIPANEPDKQVQNLERVLYHKYAERTASLSDDNAAFSDTVYEETAYPDILYTELKRSETELGKWTESGQKETVVSIVIPSKDQPEVLTTCVESIFAVTGKNEHIKIEIVIVDNGSSAYNRLKAEALAKKHGIQYLYKPMSFNFSVMCNIGAESTTGEYLLFLNDDMEIVQEDWMEKLLQTAAMPHVGAVGAKLLYPDSDLIQHAGVTNLAVGPAHKLLKLHDKNVYYHGQNRYVYDMIGVTAACLMIRRKTFTEVGGFQEILAVAYNDVDLCFSLYEAGYYNVQRNDIILYHHESLSRGDDSLQEEKRERLLKEKKTLYTRHPELKGFDPFYNRNLAGMKHMYLCNYLYEYEREDYDTKVQEWQGGEPTEWENNCLTINIEKARLQEKMEYDEVPSCYYIEGWSYVLDMDNCQYERTLLLVGENGSIYELEVLNRYRRDVARTLEEQVHVELAGFVCRVSRNKIRAGSYAIAMLAKDKCSKQQLYKRTEHIIVIEE